MIAGPAPEVVLGRHLGDIPNPDRPMPVTAGAPALAGCLPIARGMALASIAGLLAAGLLAAWLASTGAVLLVGIGAIGIGAVRLRRTTRRLRDRVAYLPLPADVRRLAAWRLVLRSLTRCWPLTIVFAGAAAAAGGHDLALAAAIMALLWFGQAAGYWAPCLWGTMRDQRARGCQIWMPVPHDSTHPTLYTERPDRRC